MTESTSLSKTVDPNGFRSLMAEFPTGVAVVTTLGELGEPRGMTCTSLCSLSLDPPTLLVCLRAQSPTLAEVLRQGAFTVNLLHERARRTAELFASGAADRFELVDWELPEGAAGPHLVRQAHAIADCRVVRTEDVGSHLIVFGEVRATATRHGPGPLLYGRRSYRGWSADAV
ncbi:flavin reductase family protein [Kutzneria viridogrisea]|uniref:Flavin reductase like domain-containing protein n=2 Tax=Kutzneria TaxID=43356 RepID=W5WES4_9PSEU|nr:flavin reductase family protein [Kutzneria albida]AHH99260.1 hypothetical protein KALB_5899 [Kutzneria albida DSM 43870]MBA8923186.1 flavin reductase (DIM6/NTAB) family NADH-FMN oxidoreductase RutF [Kutzneria viridogrisea]